ncbi:RNA-directed DNA polymerase, eukaryota [Tanacetum coccineum]
MEQESSKKQKVEEDKETSKLQSLIEIVYDEEEVSIDAIPLATKPPTIVYWKIHKEGKNSYYQIIRADGSSKMYRVLGLIPINRGLIQAIPISLPLQLTGEAKKASTFKAFTWVSRRFHTLLTFVFRIVQNESCGSWDRPTMLATDDMHQWRSRFLQYIDTRPNGDALRKCILKGPYTPTIVTTPAVPATEDSPAVPEQTTVETVMNMTPKTELHLNQKKEAIICMTGIGDVIYHMLMHVRTAQGNVGKPSKGSNKEFNVRLRHKRLEPLEQNDRFSHLYMNLSKEMHADLNTLHLLKIELESDRQNSQQCMICFCMNGSLKEAPFLNVLMTSVPISSSLVLHQMTSDHNRSELGIHDHSNEQSSSSCSQAIDKSPTHYPCDSARTFRVILFSIHNDEWKSFQCHHQTALRSYALSWKPCQGDSLNLPDHRQARDDALRNWEAQIDQLRRQEREVSECKMVHTPKNDAHQKVTSLIERISSLPEKPNPVSLTIPCSVDIFDINGIADLEASVNIMSESILEELSLADPKNANIIVEMADKTRCVSQGIIENVLVKIDKFSFTSDFVIIDAKELNNKTIILGRPFLANIRAEINISTREVSLGIKEDRVKIKMKEQECNLTTAVSEHLNERPTSQDELSYGAVKPIGVNLFAKNMKKDTHYGHHENKLGGQTQEKTITEEQEDPEKCGETKTRAIIGAMINKLPEEWFSGVSRDMDDLEGIIDYLEPTLYDGFIDHNDEAYKRRRNKLLGMPYTEPPPIIRRS